VLGWLIRVCEWVFFAFFGFSSDEKFDGIDDGFVGFSTQSFHSFFRNGFCSHALKTELSKRGERK
jgi:hypothetical protein